MKKSHAWIVALAVALFSAAFVSAGESGKSVVVPKGDLKWKTVNDAGVAVALVSGDMDKGPSRFFLKYPVGLTTPLHFHSADHHVAMISGTITLTVGGKEHRIGPGSYFMLADKAPHIGKVEGSEDAVFFIQADGPWDVVPSK